LIPSIALYPLSSGNGFGSSVAVDVDTVVVGATGFSDADAIYLGRSPVGEGGSQSTGAAFVFHRTTALLDFKFSQRLQPSNVRSFDQFGFAVDLDGNHLIVSSLEDSVAAFVPSKPIIEIRTLAAYNLEPLGGTFLIKWRFTNTSSDGYTLTTRSIPYNVPAYTMKHILETDLEGIGRLLVSRSNVDSFDGGYSWLVTFLSSDQDKVAHVFEADTTFLTGSNATVAINLIHGNPLPLRGKAHLFQRPSAISPFVEEFFLTPYAQQPVARCGQAVAISAKYALVGCPNRDQSVPAHNSGAGFLFKITLLGAKFSKSEYLITEGETAMVRVQHDEDAWSDEEDIYLYISSVDRNANAATQKFIENLYGVDLGAIQYPNTVVDHVGIAGKAVGRAQFYGSIHNESRW
jgi:hypothetical protein